MSNSLKEIQASVKKELDLFQVKFNQNTSGKTALLNLITDYILKRKGKQIRPLFVLLTSKLHHGINESTYTAASLIELLHTATLVHDDVVDDATYRRGLFSINALWKNKAAVLIGDYLLSRGLLIAIENKEFELLEIVSKAVKQMSEGELLQIEKARKLDITEDIYFEIIKDKTASLIASCCACGTKAGSGNEEEIEQMRLFGEYIGIAFQIKDDLLDYGYGNNTGKKTGADFKEKKMTLPLIYALNKCTSSEKRWLINTVKNHGNNATSVSEAIKLINRLGGIDYTIKIMDDYKSKALSILDSYSDSDTKAALINLVEYTINRDK